MYERSALILDTAACALGDVSLGLINLGIRPVYATDLEELLLQAAEDQQRAGALLAPPTVLVERLARIRKRLLDPLGLPCACVLPVGPRPSDADVATLAAAGVRWAAFEPIAPRDLRYVVSLVLSLADKSELRLEPRLPCQLPTDVQAGERRLRATLSDLTTGGGYLACRAPLRPGTPLKLSFRTPDALIETGALVCWRTSPDGGFPGWLEPGMGVRFDALAPAALATVRQFLDAGKRRFLVHPATGA